MAVAIAPTRALMPAVDSFDGEDRRALRNAALASAVGGLQASLPAALPLLLLYPPAPSLRSVALTLAAMALLTLLAGIAGWWTEAGRLSLGQRRSWPLGILPLAAGAAAAGLGAALGDGLPLLALLFLCLQLCSGFWSVRAPVLAALLTAAAAACGVEIGTVAIGAVGVPWLPLAAASLAAAAVLARARIRADAGVHGEVRSTRHQDQARDLLLGLLLGVCALANLALLVEPAQIRPHGLSIALLPFPFLLLGLLRASQLAFLPRHRRSTLPSFSDPVIAVAVAGWAATLLLGPLLPLGH